MVSEKKIVLTIIIIYYSESRETSIQAIMEVSSKSLNYLPIFFSNSMVDRKVDSYSLSEPSDKLKKQFIKIFSMLAS